MKRYATAQIRNVALVGHSGAGKTSLAEALLHRAGAISRMGRVEDGTTVAFDTELFREGMELFIQGWADAFDETGLGWDDSTNNSAYLSDQISATQNGTSIYIAAADEESENYQPEIAEDTYHALLPAGPAGPRATSTAAMAADG